MSLSDTIIDIFAVAFRFLDHEVEKGSVSPLTPKNESEKFREIFAENVLQKSRRSVQLDFDERFKPLLCLPCSTFGML